MEQMSQKRTRIRVCVNTSCCMRGSEKVYDVLRKEFSDEAEVSKTSDCFRFCKSGPNVSVNGAILNGMRPHDACVRVKREIDHPSRKVEGVGTKSIDELDAVLDGLFI